MTLKPQPQIKKQNILQESLFIAPVLITFKWPVTLIMTLDMIFTLVGQSHTYWKNPQHLHESNPVFHYLMKYSNNFLWLFMIFGIYFIITHFLILKTKNFTNSSLVLGLFMGHLVGCVTWIMTLWEKFTYQELRGSLKFYLLIGFVVIIAIISSTPLLINRQKFSQDTEN